MIEVSLVSISYVLGSYRGAYLESVPTQHLKISALRLDLYVFSEARGLNS